MAVEIKYVLVELLAYTMVTQRAVRLFTVVHVITLLVILLRGAICMTIIASTPLFIPRVQCESQGVK